jgi:transcriptional antiterminator Rof (Rho-off)
MIEDDPYRPIPCDLHSSYELAAIRGAVITLEWQDGAGGVRRAQGKVLDLLTRQGVELLVFEPSGGCRVQIRLDRIRQDDFDRV